MANSLPCVPPAKTPPAQQHVQRESLQSITSSLQSTACFVAPFPVGDLELGPLFSKSCRTLAQQSVWNAEPCRVSGTFVRLSNTEERSKVPKYRTTTGNNGRNRPNIVSFLPAIAWQTPPPPRSSSSNLARGRSVRPNRFLLSFITAAAPQSKPRN